MNRNRTRQIERYPNPASMAKPCSPWSTSNLCLLPTSFFSFKNHVLLDILSSKGRLPPPRYSPPPLTFRPSFPLLITIGTNGWDPPPFSTPLNISEARNQRELSKTRDSAFPYSWGKGSVFSRKKSPSSGQGAASLSFLPSSNLIQV